MDVVDLLQKFKVDHVYSGKDVLIKCLNPDHPDRNPSMRIDKITGVFHCFSCGYKGNLFKHYGVEKSKLDVLRTKVKRQIEKITIEQVGLNIPEKAEFWDQSFRGVSKELYIKFRAFVYEEDFPNRLIFPIYDITGKITNFCARSFNVFEKPKYKMYPPGASPPLFPMWAKPKFGTIILVEGIFDMLKLHDNGITFCMTAFGTKTIDEEKLNLLRLLGVTEIHLLFDGDIAGQNAAAKLAEFIDSKGFVVRNINPADHFGEGIDPGSLTKEQINKLRMKEWPEYL